MAKIRTREILYISGGLIIAVTFSILSTLPTDLDIFMDGAAKFKAGANPYTGPFIRELQYYYSPFFAMMLSFLLWVPIEILKFSWMVLILLAMWRTGKLFIPYFSFDPDDKRVQYWFWITIILSSYFIWLNILTTQMSVFILWAFFESARLASEKKYMAAGIIIGVFLNIKLLTLPVLAYLIYRGYFKAAFYTIITFVLLIALPALYKGWNANMDLHSMWWHSINPGNREHLVEADRGWYSLSLLIPKYFDAKNIPVALMTARLFFIALTLYFLNTAPFKKAKSALYKFRELSYLTMIIVLIFPHQRFYSYYFLIPAITYEVFIFIFNSRYFSKPVYYASLVVFIIAFGVIYLGKDMNEQVFIWIHQRAIKTWALIALIPVLALLTPRRIPERLSR